MPGTLFAGGLRAALLALARFSFRPPELPLAPLPLPPDDAVAGRRDRGMLGFRRLKAGREERIPSCAAMARATASWSSVSGHPGGSGRMR